MSVPVFAQLPNGANVSTQMCAERRDKVAETLTHLQQLAKRLRLVYLKVIHDARHLDDQSELVQSVEVRRACAARSETRRDRDPAFCAVLR